MEFRFLAFWFVLDTWIGKVQQQRLRIITLSITGNNPCIGKVQRNTTKIRVVVKVMQ